MNDGTEDKLKWSVHCSRFGGTRCALACAHFDRYRSCRKRCSSLRDKIKEHEDFPEKVIAEYQDRKTLMTSNYSCKGIPSSKVEPFTCPICSYVARSERGLKSHMTRSHGRGSYEENIKRDASKEKDDVNVDKVEEVEG